MKYSFDIPTKEGFYWIDSDIIDKGIYLIFKRPGHDYLCVNDPRVCQHTKSNFLALQHLDARYAGPIKEPKN